MASWGTRSQITDTPSFSGWRNSAPASWALMDFAGISSELKRTADEESKGANPRCRCAMRLLWSLRAFTMDGGFAGDARGGRRSTHGWLSRAADVQRVVVACSVQLGKRNVVAESDKNQRSVCLCTAMQTRKLILVFSAACQRRITSYSCWWLRPESQSTTMTKLVTDTAAAATSK